MITVLRSNVTVSASVFDTCIATSLFDVDSSNLIVSNSLFTGIFTTSMFKLNISHLTAKYSNFFNCSGGFLFDSYQSILTLKSLESTDSIFGLWFNICEGGIYVKELSFFGVDHDLFYLDNCSQSILSGLTISHSNLKSLIYLLNSKVSISNITILNSTGSTLFAGCNSNLTLNSCYVSASVFNSLVSLSFSEIVTSSVELKFCRFSENLLFLSNSTSSFENLEIFDVHSNSFFTSLDSVTQFKNTIIRNFDFLTFLYLSRSNTIFNSLSKTTCQFQPLDYTVHDIVVIESELTFRNSEIAGCVLNDLFKNSVFLDTSLLVLDHLDSFLFLSSLSLVNSNCTIFSKYSIISKIVEVDDDTIIAETTSLINLAELSSNVSLSPSKHCCNTSLCHVSLYLEGIFGLANVMSIGVKHSQSFNYIYDSNSLNLIVGQSESFNFSSPLVLFSFIIDLMAFSYELFIPICSIEFISLQPPTRGGFVPLFASNLGLAPVIILDSTAAIEQSFEYSPDDHEILNILFFEGHGCHDMSISRSTDIEVVHFNYCFRQPYIQSISPNPFPLSGSLILKGSDFSTNFEYLSIIANRPQVVIVNYTHDEVIITIPYICHITSNNFEIFLVIGNQMSNSFQLTFGPPFLTYQPVPLSPSGGIILLNGVNFSKMLNCFYNSSIEFSVGASTVEVQSAHDMTIETGDLDGVTQFVIYVEFFRELNFLISIPVTSFVASNTDFVCFTGSSCVIEVYSYLQDFTYVATFIKSVDPEIIHILNFQPTVNSVVIAFISFNPGIPTDLEICGHFGCFPIFNLPFIIEPSFISPESIQLFNLPVATEILVEANGIAFYHFDVILNSFYFENCQSSLLSYNDSFLNFNVLISEVGNCVLLGSSFLNTCHFNLSFETNNYLIFPPVVFFNSRIEFILTEVISDLFITHGNQTVPVKPGVNILNLTDLSLFVTLHRISQSMTVSYVTSVFTNDIPDVLQTNFVQSFLIDLNLLPYNFEVSCAGNCDIHLDHFVNSSRISFVAFGPGAISPEFFFFYQSSNFIYRVPIVSKVAPRFQILSPTVITTSESSIVIIQSYSEFDLNSSFFTNESIIEPTHVELISNSDSFFAYRFELNLTSLPVYSGESVQNLFWFQPGFEKQFISSITIFNLELYSNDYVSVFQPRDVSISFQGQIISNLTCFIENQFFTAHVVDGALICKNVIIQTYRQHVTVDVYFNTFLLNSIEISGEAFLDEICFETFSSHPLVNSSEVISNLRKNLIFDGSRCCNVEVSHCSEYLSKFESASFLFQSKFDIYHVVITTNSSCRATESDLYFDLMVNNQTMFSFISCELITSGFSFASMCKLDLLLPKTSEITLIALENLYLLEIEFYGYKSNTCYEPFSFGKGVTSLGEVIDEDVRFRFNNQLFSSVLAVKHFVIQMSTFWSSSILIFPIELYSIHCYQSTVDHSLLFSSSAATTVHFLTTEIQFNTMYLNFSVPVMCSDFLNFIVDCTGEFTVVMSTFEFSDFYFLNDSLVFSVSNMINLGNHYFSVTHDLGQFHWNGTIFQYFNEVFEMSDFSTDECTNQFTFDNSCTLLKVNVLLTSQNLFSNYSKNLSTSDLKLHLASSSHILNIFDGSSLELVGPPLQSMTITFSYFSHSETINVFTNDCLLPKLNSGHGCLCPKGMEYNFVGDCVECTFNYYSSLEFNSECRSCPFPRITLQKGSSGLDQCVCPLNTLDSIDVCLPCPHLAECGFGNLTGIQPGFRLNTDTWELDECVFGSIVKRILADHVMLMEICVNTVLKMLVSVEFTVLDKNIYGSRFFSWYFLFYSFFV
ncbi:hypothetical protein GEMRC1_008123 [Eukaryota sp. GEM-RC1]